MLGYHRFGGNDGAGERGDRPSLWRERWINPELVSSVNDAGSGRDLSAEIHRLPERRRQLVFRIRRQIAEGTYETPDKLEMALDRLFAREFADDVTA